MSLTISKLRVKGVSGSPNASDISITLSSSADQGFIFRDGIYRQELDSVEFSEAWVVPANASQVEVLVDGLKGEQGEVIQCRGVFSMPDELADEAFNLEMSLDDRYTLNMELSLFSDDIPNGFTESKDDRSIDLNNRPVSQASYEHLENDKPETIDQRDDKAPRVKSSRPSIIRSVQQSVSEGLWPSYCDPSYVMPNSIEVKVSLPTGDYYFPVKIIKSNAEKLYFGGYRNKNTGTIYHHAVSQTPREDTKYVRDTSSLRTRETQTTATRTLSNQTIRESGTQMDREDVLISKNKDTVKISRRYITAEQVLAVKMVKAIIIQKYWRSFLAKRRANGIRHRNEERDRALVTAKEEILRQQKLQSDENARRRLQPKTNADFEILYNELDAWRRAEITKVKLSDMSEEKKSAAFAALLQEETDALQSIERLKLAAYRDLHNNKNERMLELMAQPRQWQLSSGEVANVITPETTRAKELLELYRALISPVTTVDSRLEYLLKTKRIVQPYSDRLSYEISDLVDRESDLLNRGRPFKSMEKLRIRIAHLFLEFIECPDYNPRAADFINVSVTVNR